MSAVNRIANTRRELPLSDEERLREALAKIERVRIELWLDQALGQIERAADDLRRLARRGAGGKQSWWKGWLVSLRKKTGKRPCEPTMKSV